MAVLSICLRNLIVFVVFCIIQKCHGQDSLSCAETFERYFGYHLSNNISADFILRNFSVENASIAFKSCRKACTDDPKCQGFSIDFLQIQCSTYNSYYENEAKFLQVQLESRQGSIFWRRICLKTQFNCTYSWYYDVWPLFSIRPEKIDRFLPVSSSEHCQEACNMERNFQCRSAMYNYVTRNCHLSRHDRRSLATYVTDGTNHEIYLENQCVNSMTTGCEFTLEKRGAPIWLNSSPVEDAAGCEKLCLHNNEFLCRSYSYSPNPGQCNFGAEDEFSLIRYDDNRTTTVETATYFQRGECTNVQVICDLDQMVANFRADRAFDGKIMSLQSPKTCTFNVKQQFDFNVSFSLQQKPNCGIVDEDSNTISLMITMQYHDMVITGKDKALKLVCKYELLSKTVSNFVELGEGTAHNNATVVTGGGGKSLPEAYMRIVNGDGQTVTTAEVGQTLYAEVLLKDSAEKSDAQSEYSLFVNHCQALDEGQSVILVDDAGCPLDTTLFEGFHFIQNGNNKILRAAFQGFRFQTKRRVNINCNVNFCFKFCQPALCADKNGRRVMSLGKKKRAVESVVYDEKIIGQIRVESEFEVLDSRNIAVVISDSAYLPYRGNQMSTTAASVSMNAMKGFAHIIWPVLIVVICLIFIVVATCVRCKRISTEDKLSV